MTAALTLVLILLLETITGTISEQEIVKNPASIISTGVQIKSIQTLTTFNPPKPTIKPTPSPKIIPTKKPSPTKKPTPEPTEEPTPTIQPLTLCDEVSEEFIELDKLNGVSKESESEPIVITFNALIDEVREFSGKEFCMKSVKFNTGETQSEVKYYIARDSFCIRNSIRENSEKCCSVSVSTYLKDPQNYEAQCKQKKLPTTTPSIVKNTPIPTIIPTLKPTPTPLPLTLCEELKTEVNAVKASSQGMTSEGKESVLVFNALTSAGAGYSGKQYCVKPVNYNINSKDYFYKYYLQKDSFCIRIDGAAKTENCCSLNYSTYVVDPTNFGSLCQTKTYTATPTPIPTATPTPKNCSILPATTQYIKPGGKQEFIATCFDSTGQVIPCKTMIWEANPTQGTISKQITSEASPTNSFTHDATFDNDVIITATESPLRLSCSATFRVARPYYCIMQPSEKTISNGETIAFEASCRDQTGTNSIECPEFAWEAFAITGSFTASTTPKILTPKSNFTHSPNDSKFGTVMARNLAKGFGCSAQITIG